MKNINLDADLLTGRGLWSLNITCSLVPSPLPVPFLCDLSPLQGLVSPLLICHSLWQLDPPPLLVLSLRESSYALAALQPSVSALPRMTFWGVPGLQRHRENWIVPGFITSSFTQLCCRSFFSFAFIPCPHPTFLHKPRIQGEILFTSNNGFRVIFNLVASIFFHVSSWIQPGMSYHILFFFPSPLTTSSCDPHGGKVLTQALLCAISCVRNKSLVVSNSLQPHGL